MKKFILTILLLGIIGGAAIFVYGRFFKQQLAIDTVIASDVLAYIHVSDVQGQLDRIKSSTLVHNIQNIDYNRLVEQKAITLQQKQTIEQIVNKINLITDNPAVNKIFGQEVALAVYPTAMNAAQLKEFTPAKLSGILEDVLSNVVVVTRVSKDIEVLESFLKVFNLASDEYAVESTKYKDHIIHVVSFKKFPLKVGLVRLNDLLVIGVGENVAQTSVDVYAKAKPALSGDGSYQLVKKKYLPTKNFESFVHIDKIFSLLGSQANISGISLAAISSNWDKSFKSKYDLYIDENTSSSDVAAVYAHCRSTENKSLKFIPKDVIGYQWGGCMDLNYYWEQIKKSAENEAKKQEGKGFKPQTFETMLGINVEQDLLPAVGQEFGGYLKDVQMGAMFPIPELVLFTQVKDKTKMDSLLDNLLKRFFMPAQVENYGNTSLKYLKLPLGESIEPSFCFLDDYLLIGINRNLLKNAIDAYQDKGKSILVDERFKSLNLGAENPGIGLYYLKLDVVMDQLKQVIEWGLQWIQSQDEQRQAFIDGQQKRLEEIQNEARVAENEVAQLREQKKKLLEEVDSLLKQGQDVAAKKQELENMGQAMDKKQTELDLDNKRVGELTTTVEGYKQKIVDPQTRRLMVQEFVYPILEGIKDFSTIGVTTWFKDNVVESTLIIKPVNGLDLLGPNHPLNR